jgi:carbon-monoxide dehydrogenase large subunit
VKFAIGQPIARLEDHRLLTGGGRYSDDLRADGMAFGYVLRSPYAHGDIRAIDADDARSMPGVITVLTAADAKADGLGDMPCLIPLQNRDGSERAETPRAILAGDRVRHIGEPVAFVVAETLAEARDAAEAIVVDYDERPAVTDTAHATDPGQPLVWDDVPDNVCFDWESGDKAGVEAAFAKADHVVRLELVNNRVVSNPMEPRAVLAEYDAESDRSTLYTPSQGVHFILPQLAEQVLKIGKEKLRIVSYDVGGGFGTRIFLYPEQALALWASRRIGRAVKWTGERSEIFMSDYQGRDNVSIAEMALDGDGHYLGLRVTTYAALGAYLSNYGPFIPTMAGTNMLVGLYKTPAIYVNVKGVFTNTVPTDAYRGAGRPEAAYLIERLTDLAAREIGMSPDEIRRRNFIPPEAMPYRTPMGDAYDSGEFTALMEECMAKADWANIAGRRAEAKRRGKLRGIGLACYIERCGGGNPETAIVEFNDDDTLTAYIGNQHNGQGHVTTYTQVLSDRLGIDAEKIRVIQGDSDRVPTGMTGGSRAAPVGGAAMLGVADKVIEKGRQVAAQMLETAAVDVEYDDGTFAVAGTDRRMTLFEVARAARDPANLPEGIDEAGLDDAFTRVPEAPTFPNGCHVCEVEIDPDTGIVDIVRYSIVDDFGDCINPTMLQGQVHGGIAQGVGQAMTEQTVYEPETGQLLTATFMDYAMPRADILPSFDFSLHNVRCTTNPLGLKGAGEAGTIGAMPALINAIVDALEPEIGLRHIDMPATPERVWQALHVADG